MNIFDEAYHQFSISRFPLPSEQQLAEIEERINVSFPEEYRRFILQYNGGYFSDPTIEPVSEGCPQDGLRCLHGIGASHEEAELGYLPTIYLFEDNDPPQIVPVGRTTMDG